MENIRLPPPSFMLPAFVPGTLGHLARWSPSGLSPLQLAQLSSGQFAQVVLVPSMPHDQPITILAPNGGTTSSTLAARPSTTENAASGAASTSAKPTLDDDEKAEIKTTESLLSLALLAAERPPPPPPVSKFPKPAYKTGKKKKKRAPEQTAGMYCRECGTTESPEWRRGEEGPKTLCNGCGLRWAKRIKQEHHIYSIRDTNGAVKPDE